jgi:hypothetical protein
VRIGLRFGNAALQYGNAFGGRVALRALGSDFVGSFRLVHVARPIAHKAPPTDLKDNSPQSA